jgi:hypothetical protein
MSRQKPRGRPAAAPASPFDQARDEMFQQVMRCGVIGSDPAHQAEWFDETMTYLGERYHERKSPEKFRRQRKSSGENTEKGSVKPKSFFRVNH